jgi:hypothetical protein
MKFIIIFLLFIPAFLQSQTIQKIEKRYALIELKTSSDVKVGDEVNVFRSPKAGIKTQVGRLKIIKIVQNKGVGRIIMEKSGYKISVGDFIGTTQTVFSITHDKYYTYVPIGAGLLAGGLSYYFHSSANHAYKDYKSALNPSDAAFLYDKTIKLDKKSQVGLGIGVGFIAVGIVYSCVTRNHSPLNMGNALSISTCYRHECSGITLGMNFNFSLKKF